MTGAAPLWQSFGRDNGAFFTHDDGSAMKSQNTSSAVSLLDSMVIQNNVRMDRWIVGGGVDSPFGYVVHFGHPLFVCKHAVVEDTDQDTLDRAYTTSDGHAFWDFVWIGCDPPDNRDLVTIIDLAADAVGRHFFR